MPKAAQKICSDYQPEQDSIQKLMLFNNGTDFEKKHLIHETTNPCFILFPQNKRPFAFYQRHYQAAVKFLQTEFSLK